MMDYHILAITIVMFFHEKTCTYDHQNVSYLLYLKNRKTYLLITNIIIDIQSSLGIIGEHD